jgi:large subunit ribosomal protein L9
MKVILIKQVAKVGNPGDTINVSNGYARNFLIPKELAIEASKQALGEVKRKKDKKVKENTKRDEAKSKLHNVLEGQTILIRAQANEEGHLFGGIGPKEIAATVLKRKKIEIDSKQIDLAHHLKELGKHQVVLKLGGGEELRFSVDIQREEE